jgi:hypothetical protein
MKVVLIVILLAIRFVSPFSRVPLARSSALSSLKAFTFCIEEMDSDNLSVFQDCLLSQDLDSSSADSIIDNVRTAGWSNSLDLIHFARDFEDRPEVLSTILQSDFNFSAFHAHKMRSGLSVLARAMKEKSKREEKLDEKEEEHVVVEGTKSIYSSALMPKTGTETVDDHQQKQRGFKEDSEADTMTTPTGVQSVGPRFKQVVVNRAQQRRRIVETGTAGLVELETDEVKVRIAAEPMQAMQSEGEGVAESPPGAYGMLDLAAYPQLSSEMRAFNGFMTQPTALSQDPPLRVATARVYMRHALLFLGWYTRSDYSHSTPLEDADTLSLFAHIFPSSNREAAQPCLDFIRFLRQNRGISVSYEANMLRGLTKVLWAV